MARPRSQPRQSKLHPDTKALIRSYMASRGTSSAEVSAHLEDDPRMTDPDIRAMLQELAVMRREMDQLRRDIVDAMRTISGTNEGPQTGYAEDLRDLIPDRELISQD